MHKKLPVIFLLFSMVRLTIDRTCRRALFILVLAISLLMAFDEARAELITFADYPLGTTITNQYQNRGVIFSGEPQHPIISIPDYFDEYDGPALMGASIGFPYRGSYPVTVTFVDPTDGTPVEAIDVGFYYYVLGGNSFLVTYYDINGGIIGQTDLWDDPNPHIPPKLHKITFESGIGSSNYFWLDNLSFQSPEPLETEWIYPDSVKMGENYNIILRVHNPNDASQTLSFLLNEERLPHGIPIFWNLDDVRAWRLDRQPYNGEQEEREIRPYQTEDFIFTLNHKWQWIEPWSAMRLINIVTNLVLTYPGLELLSMSKTLVDTILESITHVGKINYHYEGIANSQWTASNIEITVPASKKIAWGTSVFTGIAAGKCTGAGLVLLATGGGVPLLIAEAVFIASAEVEYAIAADPVTEYTQIAFIEPVPVPAACFSNEEPATTVAEVSLRLLGTLNALHKSYVRYDAAEDAGSQEWMDLHLTLARVYAEEAAQIKAELVSILGDLVSPIEVPGEDEIDKIRQEIAELGLPWIEKCILAELGYTAEEIAGIEEDTIEFPNDFFVNFHDLPTTLGESGKSHEIWAENLPPHPEGATLIFDVDPDTLKDQNKGGWITVYIELPEEYNVSDINLSNVTLAGITPQRRAHRAGDHDRDGVSDLKVKFARREIMTVLKLGVNIIPVTVILEGGVEIARTVIIRLIHK